jgi:hypothetical protein
MNFTVKNIKSFNGHEGIGYSATLYLDGKKFAEVLDDANGGEVDVNCFDWKDPNKVTINTYIDKDGVQHTWDVSPNYALLHNYVLTLPKWKSSFSDEMYDMTVGLFVEELVNKILDEKKLAKAKKKGICFKLNTDGKNTYRTINTHDMEVAVNYLNKQFGINTYQFI